jgi:hypothetical protein
MTIKEIRSEIQVLKLFLREDIEANDFSKDRVEALERIIELYQMLLRQSK